MITPSSKTSGQYSPEGLSRTPSSGGPFASSGVSELFQGCACTFHVHSSIFSEIQISSREGNSVIATGELIRVYLKRKSLNVQRDLEKSHAHQTLVPVTSTCFHSERFCSWKEAFLYRHLEWLVLCKSKWLEKEDK